VQGMHGYSKYYSEMRPYFIAVGPAFKKGYRIPRNYDIENIDIYPLLAHLMGIKPASHNGSFERISPILFGHPDTHAKVPSFYSNFIPFAMATVAILYIIQKMIK
jgi:hypothetical protein